MLKTVKHISGSAGGYLVGRLHTRGGIKAINKSVGQPLEMQGGEVVITAPAVEDETKHDFDGKMLTNRQILSSINQSGGGVSFADGGEVPATIRCTGKKYKYGGKTVTDYEIVSSCGCKHEKGGIVILTTPEKKVISTIRSSKFLKKQPKSSWGEIIYTKANEPEHQKEVIQILVDQSADRHALINHVGLPVANAVFELNSKQSRIDKKEKGGAMNNRKHIAVALIDEPTHSQVYQHFKRGALVQLVNKDGGLVPIVNKLAKGGTTMAAPKTYSTEPIPPMVIAEEGIKLPKASIKNVREIELKITDRKDVPKTQVRSSFEINDYLRKIWDDDRMRVQESFFVLYLDRSNKILGYQELSRGSITGTIADTELVIATASKALAKGVVIAHNHPSENIIPSPADESLTRTMKEALKLVEIKLIDHIIISPDGRYYSFNDEGRFKKGGKVGKYKKGGCMGEDYAKGGPTMGDIIKDRNKTDSSAQFNKDLRTIEPFTPGFQISYLKKLFKGEESEAAVEIASRLAGIISKAAKTYQTEKQETDDKIVFLHYFYGGSDWYIVEKDIEPVQLQMFGYVILNGDMVNAEWGYVSAEEIKGTDKIELDFYWEPKPFGEVKKKWEQDEEVKSETQPSTINLQPATTKQASTTTASQQASTNAQIRNLVKEKGADRSKYSAQELELLKLYEGAGAEKKTSTDVRILDQFFTPMDICAKMWGLAFKHGFTWGQSILEPAVGPGRFLSFIPEDATGYVRAYDVDDVSVTICKLLYPKVDTRHASFETEFFKGRRHIGLAGVTAFYDLVIGNPPYREYVSEYAPLGEKDATGAFTFEMYFIMRGIDVLVSGGLLVFIIPNTFLSNDSKYNGFKESLARKCDLVDAYRLPNGIFGNTDVGTDIIVLIKK